MVTLEFILENEDQIKALFFPKSFTYWNSDISVIEKEYHYLAMCHYLTCHYYEAKLFSLQWGPLFCVSLFR